MKKQLLNKSLDTFFDLTGMFWQAGVVITGLIICFAILTLKWAIEINSTQSVPTSLGTALESVGWIFYAAPVVVFLIAYLFANRTYQTYCEQT